MKMYPDDQEAKKELEFLQSRIAQENVEEPAPGRRTGHSFGRRTDILGRVDMQLYDFKEIQERVILVGVQTDIGDDVEASLDELQELAETAGAETAAKVSEQRSSTSGNLYRKRQNSGSEKSPDCS